MCSKPWALRQQPASVWSSNTRVTVGDSGTNLTGLTKDDISALNAKGFLGLNSTGGAWSLTVDEFSALGQLQLGSFEVVSILDHGDRLANLDFIQLKAKGISVIDADDGNIQLTSAQFAELLKTSITFGANDTVTVVDSYVTLANLEFSELANRGVDFLDTTGDGTVLSLNVAQALKYAATSLRMVTGDSVRILDYASTINNISKDLIEKFKDWGITSIDAVGPNNAPAAQIGWDLERAVAFARSGATLADPNDSIRVFGTVLAFQNLQENDIENLAKAGSFVLDAG